MALSEGFLDELKTRISLPEIIGRRVKLIRSGRDLKGCCPFHNEKTPSFHVFDDHYHCFGCGVHGDAIRFLMEAEGQDFMGAVRALAAEAGMEVPEPRARETDGRRERLHAAVAAAADWFAARLSAPEGAEARAYLARRCVEDATVQAFGLGWAPAGGLEAAIRQKLPEADRALMTEAGLLNEEGRARFRSRLMFPIHDARGRAVGFGGRLLGPGEPKYLNSADGPLFHKGRLLFNWHRAAPAARKAGRLILVEGYMDVIALARAGVAEAVAPLGTAITEEQLELAWRLTPEPILAMDGDAAGRRAAQRTALRALPGIRAGRSLGFMLLPPGEDPDDLVSRGGRPAFEALAQGAIPLEQLLFEAEAEAGPLDTPERRAGFRARLNALAQAIADPALARDYRATWAARADRMFRPTRPPRRDRRSPGQPPESPAPLAETRAAAMHPVSTLPRLLKALAGRPELAEPHLEALVTLEIADRRLAAVRDAILSGAAGAPHALEDVPPLVGPGALEAEFHARVGAALASLLALSHLSKPVAPETHFPDDESVNQAYARASRARAGRAAILRGLRAQVIDDEG